MAACVAQQSSTKLPPITYPRKYFPSITYDSKMTGRKRLFSQQIDHCNFLTKYCDDSEEINKRTKTGNYVI